MKQYENTIVAPTKWLNVLPFHWNCKKVGSLFSERKIKVSDKEYPPLSVAKIGVVPQLATAVKTDAGDNRKLVCKGDFVINSRSDRKGSCGIANTDGSVSLINIVLTPRDEWNKKYVHYLMRCQLFAEEYYRYGRGIVADLWTTRFNEMKNILLPVPPRSEQDQIVSFLDWKVSRINKLIAVKKKQMKTIKELLCATIETQIYKYPVIDIVRLKSLGKFEKGGGFSRDNLVESNGFPAVLYGDIYTQYTYQTSIITHQIDKTTYEKAPKIVKRDIVFAGTGETKDEIGKPILYNGDEVVAAGGDVIVFHTNNTINEEYLLFQLYSQKLLRFRYIKGKGDIIVHIYPKDLGDMFIPIVDNDNQFKVANDIKLMIIKSNKSIKLLKRQIEVLNTYKISLISDVVTGKIDIRDIKIPDYEYIEEEIKETEDIDKEITNIEE